MAANRTGAGVEAHKVEYLAGGKKLLHAISLSVAPGQLCAIVGPSGAGKSTLLKVLCGIKPPGRGRSTLAGRPAVEARGVPDLLGYVPQDDIVHRALRVEDVFRYAAELRLSNVAQELRGRRVAEILQLMGLSERRRVRVRRLSGGQRKRVSIGVELLTEPQALFLDEPTSGLDPGLERQLMKTLRDLARADRTIVTTTHVMESMDVVNQLVVVFDGYLAFAGSPDQALGYFAVASLRDLFSTLSRHSARDWSRRFERHRPTLERSVQQHAERGSRQRNDHQRARQQADEPGTSQAGVAADTGISPGARGRSSIEAQLAALKEKLDGERS